MHSQALISHQAGHLLHVKNSQYVRVLEAFLADEVRRDRGRGDITTASYFDTKARARAVIIAKQKGVLAGMQEMRWLIAEKTHCHLQSFTKDGAHIKKNEVLCTLLGSVRELMAFERVVLNTLGRMSGIATRARKLTTIVSKIAPHVLLTPTRKTLWNLLDKRACFVGGMGTHRLGLDDAILIKHNHIKAAGSGLKNYLQKVFTEKLSGRFIEIEVATTSDAIAATRAATAYRESLHVPFIIMFDNMSPAQIRKSILKIRSPGLPLPLLEASGGITEKNVRSYAKTGVDIISMGALTTNAPFLDVAMRIR